MKVKSVLHKINMPTLDMPVYVENSKGFDRRKVSLMEFNGHLDEGDKNVTAIIINSKRVTIYYKD